MSRANLVLVVAPLLFGAGSRRKANNSNAGELPLYAALARPEGPRLAGWPACLMALGGAPLARIAPQRTMAESFEL